MILRNVGGLIGDIIPLNLTDRLYIIIEYITTFYKVSEAGGRGEPELLIGGSEGGSEGRGREVPERRGREGSERRGL